MSERIDEARRKSEERIEDLTRCYRMASGGADPSPELVAAWRATPRRFTDKDPDEVISRLVVEGADKDNRIAALESALAEAQRERDEARAEREKYRKAATVLCGAHIGIPQDQCPVCERDEARARITSAQERYEAAQVCLDEAVKHAEVGRLLEEVLHMSGVVAVQVQLLEDIGAHVDVEVILADQSFDRHEHDAPTLAAALRKAREGVE